MPIVIDLSKTKAAAVPSAASAASAPSELSAHQDDSCIFCKIIKGEIPSRKVYEDDDVYAFHDIAPWAPIHFLIIPKTHYANLEAASSNPALLGKILALVPKLAAQEGCDPVPEGGYRVVINNGKNGGQEVGHMHVHVMGGPRPWLKG